MQNEDKPVQEIVVKTEYDELVDQCIETAKKFSVLFITELVSFLPFSRQTFYKYKLHENPEIKQTIEDIKVFRKQGLRAKWYDSNNPTVQIALYKLICTPEERRVLSNSDFESPDEEIKKPLIISNLDKKKFL